ncbi:MAG: hypothetical protein ABIY35_03975 [Chitinophagaceae bacterium]
MSYKKIQIVKEKIISPMPGRLTSIYRNQKILNYYLFNIQLRLTSAHFGCAQCRSLSASRSSGITSFTIYN